MESLFSIDNIFTLFMLIMLQAVLGFDNLLYISLESQRVVADKQNYVRKIGIGFAIVLRIALLFALVSVIEYFKEPLFEIHNSFVEGEFSIYSIIVLLGGVFIMYTAVKEIWHMISLEDDHALKRETTSVGKAIFMIMVMNLVFSFDSILSAIALTDVFWVMAVAIIIGGLLMIWLSEKITEFLKRNRMYEVLGLFILLIVGVMLVSEGGHLAHLKFFGNAVTAMSKATFYFVLLILVVVEVAQSKYHRKLMAEKEKHYDDDTA